MMIGANISIARKSTITLQLDQLGWSFLMVDLSKLILPEDDGGMGLREELPELAKLYDEMQECAH